MRLQFEAAGANIKGDVLLFIFLTDLAMLSLLIFTALLNRFFSARDWLVGCYKYTAGANKSVVLLQILPCDVLVLDNVDLIAVQITDML